MNKIIIIDYGMGNTASILSMLVQVGGEAKISAEHDDVSKAQAIILPGVGAFDNAVQKLQALGLFDLIKKRILEDKIHFLGICLGMQLLFKSSEEGVLTGLGCIPGAVKRFQFSGMTGQTLKIPHIGWNRVFPCNQNPYFDGMDEPRFYFVHSYHALCENPAHVAATTLYGDSLTSAVQKDRIFGVQFHPEKSHLFGMQMFRNFLKQL